MKTLTILITAFVLTTGGVAFSGVTAEQKCEGGKKLAAGKFMACRTTALKNLALRGDPRAFEEARAKCAAKFSEKWLELERVAAEHGAPCPSNGSEAMMKRQSIQCTDMIDWLASPEPIRFVDNGDGTVSDKQTGRMWEKKIHNSFKDSSLHAQVYRPWAGLCSGNTDKRCQPTSTAAAACEYWAVGNQAGCDVCNGGEGTCDANETAWTWLVELNVSNFAGHDDWYIPPIEELESLLVLDADLPGIDPVFEGSMCGAACGDVTNPDCACTDNLFTSATAYNEIFVYVASFTFRDITTVRKIDEENEPSGLSLVRAVRDVE